MIASRTAPQYAVLTVDASGVISDAAGDARRMFGRDGRSVIGTRAAGLIGLDLAELDGRGEQRTVMTRADGTPVPVQASYQRLGGAGVLVVRELDGEQIGAEARLMLDAALDASPVGTALFNTDGQYIRVNDNLCRLLGREPDELLGHRDQEFTHPDDRASDVEAAMQILGGSLDRWLTEKRFVRPVQPAECLQPGRSTVRIVGSVRSDDREILRLALPALGALAAGPLYTLVDTAIVGHLGARPLAALALAGTVLTAMIEVADFLSYGVTSQIARLEASGETERGRAVAAQALWLALGTGLVAIGLLAGLGGPLLGLVGHGAGVRGRAELYLHIVLAGIPAQLVALAGEGCLRGLGDLRSPLRILVVANLANVGLEVLFVYVLHMGLAGSALGTLIAQLGMGVAFARRMLQIAGGDRRPRWERIRPMLRTGGHLTIRTVALLAGFTLCSALAARMGTASLGAHQVAFQLFLFLALVLDAIAIAGQIMIARLLGAGDPAGARRAAVRMVGWSVGFGVAFGAVLAGLSGVGPSLFGGGAAVIAHGHAVWRLLGLMQPLAAAVFALDGILIGAGDTRYLAWAMTAAFLVFLGPALAAGDLDGLWWALNLLVAARLLTLIPRFLRGEWAVVGATAG